MSSRSTERPSPLVAPSYKRRYGLTAVAVVVFALLLGIEVASAVSWNTTRRATEQLERETFQVTTLADVVREAGKFIRMVDRRGAFTTDSQIAVQRSILVGQIQRFEARERDPDLLWLASQIRVSLNEVDVFLSTSEETDPLTPEVLESLEQLELRSKWLFDTAEIPYFDSIQRALDERSEDGRLLLIATALLGAFAGVYVVANRRASRADHHAAYLALQRSEEEHRRIVNEVKEVIFTTDHEGRWTFLSAAWTTLTGFSVDESLGHPFMEWVHVEDVEACGQKFAELANGPLEESHHETRYVRADGRIVWVDIWVRLTENGGTTGTIVDITQRRLAEDRLQHQAHHDPLTGLANRELLSRVLARSVEETNRTGRQAAILFLDLDRFKFVNDSLGHDVGDVLLCEVAHRLHEELRPGDVAARLGGDEFVLVCPNLSSVPGVAINEARAVSERVEAAIARPVEVGGQSLHITASVGVTLVRDVERLDTLISEADAAMYRAKQLGKARHQIFDDGLRAEADHRLLLEGELRRALDDGEFRLHYQPIYDASQATVLSAEALVRWEHPTRGLLTPDSFLPVAEEAGLMPALGAWIIGQACEDVARWRARPHTHPDLSVAVNLSARELGASNIVERVRRALDEHDLEPSALCVEVTEHHLIDGAEVAIANLHAIHDMGVSVALDDFGTGYSSLSYLRRLPISQLKIDRVFVEQLGLDSVDETIVSVIVGLSAALQLRTVAEGVEMPTQIRVLRDLGVDRLQGYLLGRPVPSNELLANLEIPQPISGF